MKNLIGIEKIEEGDVLNVEDNIIKKITLNKIGDSYYGTVTVKQNYAKFTTDLHTNNYASKKRCLNALDTLINCWYEKQ